MSMEAVISRVVAVAEHKLAASTQKLAPNQYPTATLPHNGQWMFNNAGHWTSGFFVGCLWQLHALTGKPEWSAAAQRWQEGLMDKQRTWQSQHDYGEEQRLQSTVGAGQRHTCICAPCCMIAVNSSRRFESQLCCLWGNASPVQS
jgi:hypothetical protein